MSTTQTDAGVTIAEAARVLSVSRATIYRMIRDGRLTRVYAFERVPLITVASLAEATARTTQDAAGHDRRSA